MSEKIDADAARALRTVLGEDEIEAAGSRGALARTLAKREGISVRAARRQVRDLLRTGLEPPARGGKAIRRAWERIRSILPGREAEPSAADLTVSVSEMFVYVPDEDSDVIGGIVVGVDEEPPVQRSGPDVMAEVAHVDGGLAGEISTGIKRKKPGQGGG